MRFHHTGIACRDLDREVRWFGNLGYDPEGSVFTDPLQGIKGQFMLLGGARIELLESLPDSHVLDPWLAHGSPLYHFGYEVSDIAKAIDLLSASGAKVVSEPKPAVAFDGRQVAFLLRSNKMLVEVIESAS
jgi:methylmalonyl-CoA/ethylmalonyl-CoA epimerase